MHKVNLSEMAYNLNCAENGIYFTNAKEKISYPDAGNAYCFAFETNSFWFQHRNNVITHSVKKYCPNVIFFDIGGGNGLVTKTLQNQHIKTVLIEPGKAGVTNAKQRGVKNIIHSSFEQINFKQDVIKAVGLFDVLEHIENDAEFLQQIGKTMATGGHLFITVPAYRFLWSNDDVQAGHYRRYSLSKLVQLLKNNGFTVLRKSYLFSFLAFPVFLFRTIPSLFRKAKKEINFEKHEITHQPNKMLMKILNFMCNVELSYFIKGRNFGVGSSCFVVAKLD